MPNTSHFPDHPSRHAASVNVRDRTSLKNPPTETVQSQKCLGINYFAPPKRSQSVTPPRDTPALSTIKPPAIPSVITRDIRVAAAVTLSPLIEFACVLIGLAMAVPLAAVVWAVGP